MSGGSLFHMRKNDRRVVQAFLLLAAIFAALVYFLGHERHRGDDGCEAVQTDSVVRKAPDDARGSRPMRYAASDTVAAPERFVFDPNTADSTQLLRLGLQPWQVRSIYKFRAKGGIFRKKEDFARCYGLTVKQYRELEPYIRISQDYQPASTLYPSHSSHAGRRADSRDASDRETAFAGHRRDTSSVAARRPSSKLQPGETVELSTADTVQLKKIPGIGRYHARRIVDYGQRLGGYVSKDQLLEIENFPDEALPYITLTPHVFRHVAVNQLSLNDLKRHPYINYYQARAIIDYRRKHGPVRRIDHLRLLPDFTPDDIRRIQPYISYE